MPQPSNPNFPDQYKIFPWDKTATHAPPFSGWGDAIRNLGHAVLPTIVQGAGQQPQQGTGGGGGGGGGGAGPSFRDIAHFIAPTVVKSSSAAGSSGGGSGTATSALDPKTTTVLSQLGITGNDANSLTQQLQRSQYIAQLPAEYQPLVQQYFADQEAKKQQAATNQPFIDPLQMQAFFAQTIMPYLGQRADEIGQGINSVYNTVQQHPSSDPIVAGLMNQILPQQRAAALAQHQANVQSFAPNIYANTVMQELARSQQIQEQYNATVRNQAATNALAGLGISGGFTAPKTGG